MPLMAHPSHGLANHRRTYPAAERKASLPRPAHGEEDRKTASSGPDVELSDNRKEWNRSEDNSGRTADVFLLTWVGSEAAGERMEETSDVYCVCIGVSYRELHDSEQRRLIETTAGAHPSRY